MHAHADRYPLTWPGGWTRTRPSQREAARFSRTRSKETRFGTQTYVDRVTMPEAIQRLTVEVDRLLGISHVVLSTNVPVRLDGLPYAHQREPDDPGVALYFALEGQPRCLACDRWTRVADNMVAIAKHIDALRGIDRWDVGTMEQAFAGYLALPPAAEEWWLILGVDPDASAAEIDAAYKRLARETHPDTGGSDAAMATLNQARAAARSA